LKPDMSSCLREQERERENWSYTNSERQEPYSIPHSTVDINV
jgi:hypothetical protein